MEFTDKYDYSEGTKLTWPLKLFYFIGGQIGMSLIAFFVGLFLYETMVFHFIGLCMIVGAIVMTRIVNDEKLILAVGYPLYLSGHIILIIALFKMDVNLIVFINLCILIVSWIFCRNHFMRQAILLPIFLLIPWVYDEGRDYFNDDIIYFVKNYSFYYAIFQLGIYGFTILYDANKFSKENLYVQYIPTIRFCAVMTAILYALFGIDSYWQSISCAIGTFVVACVLLYKNRKDDTKKLVLSIGLVLLGCIASCVTPNISIAMLGLVLTFTVLDYFGVITFGLFMGYSISKFYYDLNMTLNHKSYLLLGCGIIFLSLFYFIKKLSK